MRKIKAFFTALLLVAVVAVSVHFYAAAWSKESHEALSWWTGEAKYTSMETLKGSMDENTFPVMGSSELQHQKSTPFHPMSVFAGQKARPMLIGAGYYQSLYHATALAALEPALSSRKAVLIVAPQWFRKSGVKKEAYASRFSEENYLDMLANPAVSEEVKTFIADRTEELLSVDPKTLERVKEYRERFLTDVEETSDTGSKTTLYERFLREKNRSNIALRESVYALLHPAAETGNAEKPDFDALRTEASLAGEEACGGNPFYVKKSYYDHYIVKVMDDVKDEGIKTGYSVSPEFKDFECFLKMCRDLEICPLIVIEPVNGYWYDYIAFYREDRKKYYDQVRTLAEEYDAKIADFSDREYEPYFMEDTVHIGFKGWVDVCEAIFEYACGDGTVPDAREQMLLAREGSSTDLMLRS
ncbi:MAG: D-alanyl-lipoteichoic acid biosynthesis protein DltD [Blautia sp.]|nr:D-alanyl-lipoteichoic acid biosynthesis protein DltD [Blautia sp.]